MHSRIYQLSREPLNADDFIHEIDFEEGDWEYWADYIDDCLGDQLDDEYPNFPFLNEDYKMFTRDGDCLTYLGDDTINEIWKKAIEEKYNDMISDFTNAQKKWNLKKELIQPFTRARFWMSNWCEYADVSSEFFNYCHGYLKPGDKLYLGNVLDFHW